MQLARRIALLAGSVAAALAAAPAFAQQKLDFILNWVPGGDHAPYYYAKKMGWYKDAGIDLNLEPGKGSAVAVQKVAAGANPIGLADMANALTLRGKGADTVGVFNVYANSPQGLYWLKSSGIKSVKDLAGKVVGVTAPGSSTDFFLKYLLKKNGLDPTSAAVIGVGLGATAVAAMEKGQIDAAVMLDPSVTVLQGSHPDLKILSDTRTQKDTLAVFGGEYPGGALYATAAWVGSHEKEVQALTNAIVSTLAWIHVHSPEEIMAKMPDEMVGKDKALYLAALKNTIPMYSETGKMDPKGADAVLAVFSEGSPEVAKANIDVSKTFTNKFVDQVKKTTGMNAK